MLELNKIYNLDCVDGLKLLDDNSVNLTVTSPPYDDLRSYHDENFKWNFDIFKEVADELYRVTKPGGVVVWVVGDAVINGGETGTSFKQALYFQEKGFKIHDTMIYEKNSSTFPAKASAKRYSQIFEYMFVFTKGKIRDDIKLIADKRNKWAGWTNWGTKTQYDKEGNLIAKKKNIKPTPEYSLRTNIWKYAVSFNDKTGHPAVFPEKLAEDHILSWSNEGDIVLDPFMGSGTTAKMAKLNNRNYIGFEKNTDYYEVSLKRVSKYDGKVNEAVESVSINDEDGNKLYLQRNSEFDKEEEGKTEIFNNIVEQLNEYCNDMSLSILKTLKLTFVSKANDKRVVETLKEYGISGYTKEEPVVIKKKTYEPPVTDVNDTFEGMNNGLVDEIIKEPVNEIKDTEILNAQKENLITEPVNEINSEKSESPSIIEMAEEPVTDVKENSNENNDIKKLYQYYLNDKEAFVRDCVRIMPGGCVFKTDTEKFEQLNKEESIVPEKRKRGRPRKIKEPEIFAPEKKKRGRPKKIRENE